MTASPPPCVLSPARRAATGLRPRCSPSPRREGLRAGTGACTSFLSCAVAVLAFSLGGCAPSKEDEAKAQAELRARVSETLRVEEQGRKREQAEQEADARAAAIIREKDVRAESEAGFRASGRGAQNGLPPAGALTIEAARQRMLGVVADPASADVRNARFTANRSTVCAEVNFKDAKGEYVGYRLAYATADELRVEPGRETVAHRLFELAAKRRGCVKG